MIELEELPDADPSLTWAQRVEGATVLLATLQAALADADRIGCAGTAARLSGAIDLLRIEATRLRPAGRAPT